MRTRGDLPSSCACGIQACLALASVAQVRSVGDFSPHGPGAGSSLSERAVQEGFRAGVPAYGYPSTARVLPCFVP